MNCKHQLKHWSLYIPHSCNFSSMFLENLFKLIRNNYIWEVNGHHFVWNSNNNHNHWGDKILSSICKFNLNILNSVVSTRIDCPHFKNPTTDISISYNNLSWSPLWPTLDILLGSNHFSRIIKHISLFHTLFKCFPP